MSAGRRPLIGITSSELRSRPQSPHTEHSDPQRTELALGLSYPDAVVEGGGLAVIVAPLPLADIEMLVERLDGLVLSGGPDLHPAAYGQGPHHELGPTEAELDAFELAIAATALDRGLPLLGICRGLQVLNVAMGGTLHQHLPDVLPGGVEHRQRRPGREPTHAVSIERDSELASLVGDAPLMVNSFHHQGIDVLGHGLRVVARSPDGLPEAVEGEGARGPGRLLLGVQWHVESLIESERHLALFRGLVAAASTEPSPALLPEPGREIGERAA